MTTAVKDLAACPFCRQVEGHAEECVARHVEPEAILSLALEEEAVATTENLLQRLGEVEAELLANHKARELQVQAVNLRWSGILEGLERRAAALRAALEVCLQALPLRGKKSRRLPSGEVGTRTVPEKLEIPDGQDAALVQWAWDTVGPQSVVEKMTRRVDARTLQAYVKDTGEVPPGCSMTPSREQFFARPAPVEGKLD